MSQWIHFTIGQCIEELIRLLNDYGVRPTVDVRSLASSLAVAGIGYTHLKDPGGTKPFSGPHVLLQPLSSALKQSHGDVTIPSLPSP